MRMHRSGPIERIYAMLLQETTFLENSVVRGNAARHKTIAINEYIQRVLSRKKKIKRKIFRVDVAVVKLFLIGAVVRNDTINLKIYFT